MASRKCYNRSVLILDERVVYDSLPMNDCIDAMERAFQAAARGDFVQPLRLIAWKPDKRGAVASMPAYLDGVLGAKLISVFPQNRSAGLDSHQGIVVLYETEHGRPLAILHAGAITAIRTAAVSALATRLLARDNADDLALVGSGEQAHSHLRAMQVVRPIRRVRVWSRNGDHARAFAKNESTTVLPITACESLEEAVRDAQIVCTLTAATGPLLPAVWIARGAHLNCVGASVSGFRELHADTVAAARLYVDMRATALQESDDLRVVSPDRVVGELAEMVSGACPLRESEDDITLFKSVGMAIEDLAAAHLVYERALSAGLGTAVDF
jgi:alanine dehydrogenase